MLYLLKNPDIRPLNDAIAVKCENGGVDDHEFITSQVVYCKKLHKIHKFYDTKEFEYCEDNLGILLYYQILNFKRLSFTTTFNW